MIEFKEDRVVKFHHFQKRNETHGADLVPAIDISITVKGPVSELAMIHKDLPASLFRAGDPPDSDSEQETIELPIDALSHVRVPCLKTPLKFEHDQVGMLLHIKYGLSGEKSDIVLALVKLSKVEVKEKIEGGFAVWTMLLSSSCEINEHVIGKVAMLEGYEITIVLTAPQVDEPQKALTTEDVFGPQDADPPPLTPEDVFVNQSKESEPAKVVAVKTKPAAKTARKAKA